MRIKTLKTHDSQIFIPGMVTLTGVLQAGETNGTSVEMTMQSNGTVVLDLKKGGSKARVHIPSAAYAYAVEAPQTQEAPKAEAKK